MRSISLLAKTLLLAAAAFACLPIPAAAAEITYLANEGFLLAGGGQRVLVDALFGDGLEGYAVVPKALRATLEAAQPPFDGVDLVLATHVHDDHFEPRAVGRFLAAASDARFVSTPQAVERLRTEYAGFEGIAPRVRAVLPAEGAAERLEVNGVALTVYNLHHGRGRPIENLGFLVEVGGARFFHVGDTMVDEAELAALDLSAAEIDVALFPEWYLRSAANVAMLQRVVAPERLGAMHVPTADAPADWFGPGGRDALLAGIAERVPGVLLLSEPGNTSTVETPSARTSTGPPEEDFVEEDVEHKGHQNVDEGGEAAPVEPRGVGPRAGDECSGDLAGDHRQECQQTDGPADQRSSHPHGVHEADALPGDQDVVNVQQGHLQAPHQERQDPEVVRRQG